jgi:Uma2 family endonuclease
MLAKKLPEPMSVEAFLRFVDDHPDEAWELIDGQPVARGGGTVRHAVLGGNIAEAVGPAARAKGCRALRDLFLKVAANDGNVFDPDVMVRCAGGDLLARTIEDAELVFEVLSPTTWQRDRGHKLACYQLVPSLRQIVLVYPGEVRLESWTRLPDGSWPQEPLVLSRLADALVLDGLDAELALAVVYEGVLSA